MGQLQAPSTDSVSEDEQFLQTREDALALCKSMKQRDFVEYYIGEARGNATEAARLADFSDPSYGRELLTKPHVKRAIEKLVHAETLSRAEVRHRLSQQARASVTDVCDLVEISQYISYRPGEEWKILNTVTTSAGGAEIEPLDAHEAEDVGLLHQFIVQASDEEEDDGVTLDDVRAQTEAGRLKFARVVTKVFVVNLEKARRRGAEQSIKEISYDSNGRPSVKMYDSQAALKHLDDMYALSENDQASAQAAAREQLEKATEKMGLNVNILNVY